MDERSRWQLSNARNGGSNLPELHIIEAFLDDDVRQRVLAEMRDAPATAAGVYGRTTAAQVDSRVRRVRLVEVSAELIALVRQRLGDLKELLAARFAVALSGFEEPQFLHYEPGDFFVAHQDGNTPIIRDDSLHRRVSVVIFLNGHDAEERPGTYGGGELVLHGAYPRGDERQIVPAAPGSLVAFRSETTHEVTPVTHGERYTIVSWYRQ
jgi:SM-20-related protein